MIFYVFTNFISSYFLCFVNFIFCIFCVRLCVSFFFEWCHGVFHCAWEESITIALRPLLLLLLLFCCGKSSSFLLFLLWEGWASWLSLLLALTFVTFRTHSRRKPIHSNKSFFPLCRNTQDIVLNFLGVVAAESNLFPLLTMTMMTISIEEEDEAGRLKNQHVQGDSQTRPTPMLTLD